MIDNNCVYPSLHNNSYADSNISGYRYGDVFVEKTTRGAGIACSGYANCYIGCSCNTSNGWYSSCQGTDCKSVTDTRYTGVNAMSASSVGDVTSLTDGKSAQSTTGTTQVVSLNGGVSTMSSSGATTCYKKKTCEEGGYYSSVPIDQKCSSKSYNGYTCYYSCSYKTCSDYGYKSSIPSGQTCKPTYPRSGLTCYKDCKKSYFYGIRLEHYSINNTTWGVRVCGQHGYSGTVTFKLSVSGTNCGPQFSSPGVTQTFTMTAPNETCSSERTYTAQIESQYSYYCRITAYPNAGNTPNPSTFNGQEVLVEIYNGKT